MSQNLKNYMNRKRKKQSFYLNTKANSKNCCEHKLKLVKIKIESKNPIW